MQRVSGVLLTNKEYETLSNPVTRGANITVKQLDDAVDSILKFHSEECFPKSVEYDDNGTWVCRYCCPLYEYGEKLADNICKRPKFVSK